MNGEAAYLTKKAQPGKLYLLAESVAMLLLTAGILACALVAVTGYMLDGLLLGPHAVVLGTAALLLWMLSRLTERMRARKHAAVIVRTLTVSGRMPCEELEKLTRINRLHQRILTLTAKGYLQGVTVEKSVAALAGKATAVEKSAPAQKEEAKQAKCAMCGATLVRKETGAVGCPYCGTDRV